MSNFEGDGISLNYLSSSSHPNYRSIVVYSDGMFYDFDNDSANESAEFSAGGTDSIQFTFSASYGDVSNDSTSDSTTLSGSATLDF